MCVVPRRRLRLWSRGLQCLTIRVKPGDGTTRERFYAENGAGECVSPLYGADGALGANNRLQLVNCREQAEYASWELGVDFQSPSSSLLSSSREDEPTSTEPLPTPCPIARLTPHLTLRSTPHPTSRPTLFNSSSSFSSTSFQLRLYWEAGYDWAGPHGRDWCTACL